MGKKPTTKEYKQERRKKIRKRGRKGTERRKTGKEEERGNKN